MVGAVNCTKIDDGERRPSPLQQGIGQLEAEMTSSVPLHPGWRRQTDLASDAMLARYIRDGELFIDNVAGALL
jgi:hypothetical protein